jgi:hypothetical protein
MCFGTLAKAFRLLPGEDPGVATQRRAITLWYMGPEGRLPEADPTGTNVI